MLEMHEWVVATVQQPRAKTKKMGALCNLLQEMWCETRLLLLKRADQMPEDDMETEILLQIKLWDELQLKLKSSWLVPSTHQS